MKFLVLGSNGMAGHLIALYLQERGYDVTGFARQKSGILQKSIVADASDFASLKSIIEEGKFDVIINCIGLLNQFAENNKTDAILLNSWLPHFLADSAKKVGAYVIHMSTDCVFSGKNGNYTEADFPDGKSFYDRTKALGELNDDANLTLRNSIVGPDIKKNGIGLLNWFMQQSSEVNGFTKAIWTGQTTLQLAKTMETAAKERPTGLVNAVPPFSINKYELLKLFNKYIRKEKVKINPVEGWNIDKSLIRTNFNLQLQIPDYELMIAQLADWIDQHKNLYPHYNLN
ncbi:MAG: SDR family oxidoreductase [Muribaculaceae bacterium]|nr:SDR family oxidoreductase [Muribaculaceae bacterium]